MALTTLAVLSVTLARRRDAANDGDADRAERVQIAAERARSEVLRRWNPPGRILAAVRDHRLSPVASWELAEGIAEVLRRPKLAERYGITETDVGDVISLLAPLLPAVEVHAPSVTQTTLP
jgi:hypothetical protein